MRKYFGITASTPTQAAQQAKQFNLTAMQCMTALQDPMDSTSEMFKLMARQYDSQDILMVSHAPLMSNLAGARNTRQFSVNTLIAETKRCNYLGIETMVCHPGSTEEPNGLQLLMESLDKYFDTVVKYGLKPLKQVAVETMCGAGNQLLHTPSQVVQLLKLQPKVSVCIDTCHIFGAGFLLRDFTDVLAAENLLDRIAVVHFNNTGSDKGSHKEKHTLLQEGQIPREALLNPLDCIPEGVPIILEQPKTASPEQAASEIKSWVAE